MVSSGTANYRNGRVKMGDVAHWDGCGGRTGAELSYDIILGPRDKLVAPALALAWVVWISSKDTSRSSGGGNGTSVVRWARSKISIVTEFSWTQYTGPDVNLHY
jgi:hypothetical protein